jgi:hypothetical protein
MAQNMPKDERALFRQIADLSKRVASLETATRAGHTSISSGSLVVRDTDTGEILGSIAAGEVTDDDGNTIPAGVSATAGDIDGAVLRDGSVDASKVSFSIEGGGITSTVGPTPPTDPAPGEGDLWVDTSHGNVVNRWDGTAWQALPVGTDAIQAGSITGDLIAANTITAGQLAAGIIDGETITGATLIADSESGGVFVYSGVPAAGNLIVAISPVDGTDAFGNEYAQGIRVSGFMSGDTVNALTFQPPDASGTAFAPAEIFARAFEGSGEADLVINSPHDANAGDSSASVFMRGSDGTSDASSMTLDADSIFTSGVLSPGNVIVGQTTITPTAANTPTSKNVTFPFALRGTQFFGFASSQTTVPGSNASGSAVTGVAVSAASATGATIVASRTNTTNTVVNYLVWGVE